ncbi:histidinol dehydrogenase, partial [Adlercreutzia caecimuris]
MTMRRVDLQPTEPFTADFIDRAGAFNPGALEAATAIIEEVRAKGDAALRAYTEKFDGVAIDDFRVPESAIEEALAAVDPDTIDALNQAAAQIRDFHERQRQQSWFFARQDGAIVGSKVTPLDSVGIYVPGGRALYPSTVLMNALPAQVAGVERIVCVTPPTKDGTLDATVLAACKIAGVTEIYT